MKPDDKLVAKARYIHMTADLAAEVWGECYKKFYPPKTLAALIDRLQSADAIEADMDGGAIYFIVQLGGKPIGYFAWKMENTALRLMHLYLLPAYRGRALGRDILASCERLARSDGKGRVCAEVHTKALPVLAFFKERGYRPGAPVQTDAGGILMDLTPVEKFL